MVRSGLLIALATLLTGCHSFLHVHSSNSAKSMPVNETPVYYQTQATVAPAQATLLTPRVSYHRDYTHKKLSDYAEQITMSLMEKAKWIDTDSKLGVASFVVLDRELRNSTILGNQIAESFISEIQAYGVSVVDYKTQENIDVTGRGDFVFSRTNTNGADFDYVLTGTLKTVNRGVEINARIISSDEKVVVASAKGFVPHFVVSALKPEYVLIN